MLVSQAPTVQEEQMMGYFLAGLQPNIRQQLHSHNPNELERAMEVALDLEETTYLERGGGQNQRPSLFRYVGGSVVTARPENHKGFSRSGAANTINNMRRETSNAAREGRFNTYNGEGIKNRGARTLSYPEYVKKREEGRCFHCGGHYSYGHKCPDKNLKVVICGEEEEEPMEGALPQEELEEEAENWTRGGREVTEEQPMSLSELSAGGLTQPHTMKLQGEVRGKKVLILIDSGASHNFISKDLVEELGLEVEDTPAYSVKLGYGFRRATKGCCKG